MFEGPLKKLREDWALIGAGAALGYLAGILASASRRLYHGLYFSNVCGADYSRFGYVHEDRAPAERLCGRTVGRYHTVLNARINLILPFVHAHVKVEKCIFINFFVIQ